MNSFYQVDELAALGLAKVGENVFISRKASFYSPEKIIIGNNIRIDDFCILSGMIEIGNYVHIAPYTSLHGGLAGISIKDFANLSSKLAVYAVSDDYSGDTMTNAMVPLEYRNMQNEPVVIEKHVIIGSGSVVLPGVTLREGSAFGALSLINKSSEPWTINAGIPFRKIKERSKRLLVLEKKLLGTSGES